MMAANCLAGKVSVIIPFYGEPTKLLTAVGSVADQSVAVYEVIVVDDASPAGELAERALRDMRWPFRLHFLRHDRNRGAADSRNTAWLASDPATPYLAFLDADDTWHPNKIAVQLGWMAAHSEICWTAHRCGASATSTSPGFLGYRTLHASALLLSNAVATPTVMFRRTIQPRFRPAWRHCEDLMLWLDWLTAGKRGVMLDVPLATLGRPPKSPGGLTASLAAMSLGERRVISTLHSEGRLTIAAALGWSSLMSLKYVARLLRML